MGSEQSAQRRDRIASSLLSTLYYLNWQERANVLIVSKALYRVFGVQVWALFVDVLSEQHGVYTPHNARCSREMFLDLFRFRGIWKENSDDTYDSRSKINVFARFRPSSSSIQEALPDSRSNEIVIPLHQRLRMMKLRHKVNNEEALKLLTGQGYWFKKKWKVIEDKQQSGALCDDLDRDFSNSQVAAPHIEDDNGDKTVAGVQSVDSGMGRVVMLTARGLKEFSFDGVLNDRSSQQQVYTQVASPLVASFLNGFNSCILCYGQTGSGKTHTMFGGRSQESGSKGIIPRAILEIFTFIEARRRKGLFDFSISASYVENFGDSVSDLLRGGKSCGRSKVAAQGHVLSGAAEVVCQTMADVEGLLELGDSQKKIAATRMNDRSSRAHSVFIISLHQTHVSSKVSRRSRLFLCDLGGSEDTKKSHVEAGVSTSAGFSLGEHMREAVYINLGLLALKKCIEALNTGAYVPYQDSKLTSLLAQGLGGNSKTSVIICASMDEQQATESVASLRFGERCSSLSTETRSDNNILLRILAEIDQKIRDLEAAIKQKERWALVERTRQDLLAEKDTLEAAICGKEIIKVTVLQGAEAERKQLEELLIRRSKFTGESVFEEKKRVVGFGKDSAVLYGLGDKYSADDDLQQENKRFNANVNVEELPSVIRNNKGAKQWRVEEQDALKLEKMAKKANRSKLVYSGISA